jgi:hypothetical protein
MVNNTFTGTIRSTKIKTEKKNYKNKYLILKKSSKGS